MGSNILFWVIAIAYIAYILFFKKTAEEQEQGMPPIDGKTRKHRKEKTLQEVFQELERSIQKPKEEQKEVPKAAPVEAQSKELFRRRNVSLETTRSSKKSIESESLETITSDVRPLKTKKIVEEHIEVEKITLKPKLLLDKENIKKALLFSEVLKRPEY